MKITMVGAVLIVVAAIVVVLVVRALDRKQDGGPQESNRDRNNV